jgi:hypothetical protein
MMERQTFEISRIYVPVKRSKTLEPAKVDALGAGRDDGDRVSGAGADQVDGWRIRRTRPPQGHPANRF